uniref:Uncharacterized protein n=1 Tax=Utricularia reniformis TaxID=192314 RepID=A0A1Y0B2A2_9LAMI|nr:hypothetical protein AEK19_MT1376 [Utricularia reniformis]ART31572.1 hypothetical protein AEK19_MT1376 [Utricularia reniformis]
MHSRLDWKVFQACETIKAILRNQRFTRLIICRILPYRKSPLSKSLSSSMMLVRSFLSSSSIHYSKSCCLYRNFHT